MRGKLIVIEGTDCSGKETQSKLIIEKFKKENIEFKYFSFPNYDSPTGKIVGGPYLGKCYICEGWFPETAPSVDPKVSSLYYAADRRYNIHLVNELLDNGINVILDRYFYSNMAHQGGKIEDKEERLEMYKWLEKLEVDLLELPIPDIKIFLHVPYQISLKLKENRKETESLDQHENSKKHLVDAEKSYLEIADLYGFETIKCYDNDEILSINEINDKIYTYVSDRINSNKIKKK